MKSLYTAVGRLERKKEEKGQYPVITVNRREHTVDIPEMVIWTCCSWRILELPRLVELYAQLARGAGIEDCGGVEGYTEHLLSRGLIVKGVGDTAADALYDLMNSLYIVPVTIGIFLKTAAFLKFILVNKMPFGKAKAVFRKEALSDNEKRVMALARQTQLSTAELIKCVETGVYDLSADDKVMDAIYDDDYTTCGNIGYYAKLFGKRRAVLETVANLYLRKLILFERI